MANHRILDLQAQEPKEIVVSREIPRLLRFLIQTADLDEGSSKWSVWNQNQRGKWLFDDKKLINASFEDNNSQDLEIVNGRLTPYGLSFDTTYKGEEV